MTQPDPQNHNNPSATENRFSGVFPDNNYPRGRQGELDFEQEKRLQARQESEFAAGDRLTHPAFTEKGPDATLAEQNTPPAP